MRRPLKEGLCPGSLSPSVDDRDMTRALGIDPRRQRRRAEHHPRLEPAPGDAKECLVDASASGGVVREVDKVPAFVAGETKVHAINGPLAVLGGERQPRS